MITDTILTEKRRVQAHMAELAGHDWSRLAALVDAVVAKAVQTHRLTLRFADLPSKPTTALERSRPTAAGRPLEVRDTPPNYGAARCRRRGK
jgi:hypothetical protein